MATAVVTSAMLRTWLVRFAAIRLTLSVRSFHVPATPFTTAWPPSLPSVPTSRATRVTSDENVPSCATIVFTTLAVRRNSPVSGRSSISSDIVWVRSPLATAPMTRATSVVGCTRSDTSVLTDSTAVAHAPSAYGSWARCLTLPALPTTVLRRSSSLTSRSLRSMAVLSASQIFPARPVRSSGMRTVKFPRSYSARTLNSTLWSRLSVPLPAVRTSALCFRRPYEPGACV